MFWFLHLLWQTKYESPWFGCVILGRKEQNSSVLPGLAAKYFCIILSDIWLFDVNVDIFMFFGNITQLCHVGWWARDWFQNYQFSKIKIEDVNYSEVGSSTSGTSTRLHLAIIHFQKKHFHFCVEIILVFMT